MVARLDRRRFEKIKKLMRQPWLLEKEDELKSLFLESHGAHEYNLLEALLGNFYYVTDRDLGIGLKRMAEIIVNELMLDENSTQICATAYNDEADSSQKFLDYLKMPLAKLGWGNVKTVNVCGKIVANYKKGRTNIVLIDEFVGSGKTLLSRIRQLGNDINGAFCLKVVYFSGMRYAVEALVKSGIDIRCVILLERGISDCFPLNDVPIHRDTMKNMERRLKTEIGEHNLSNYSMGYNEAESLYSLEGCHGNTPNSVFPIFWWPKSASGRLRKRLVVRFERGLA